MITKYFNRSRQFAKYNKKRLTIKPTNRIIKKGDLWIFSKIVLKAEKIRFAVLVNLHKTPDTYCQNWLYAGGRGCGFLGAARNDFYIIWELMSISGRAAAGETDGLPAEPMEENFTKS